MLGNDGINSAVSALTSMIQGATQEQKDLSASLSSKPTPDESLNGKKTEPKRRPESGLDEPKDASIEAETLEDSDTKPKNRRAKAKLGDREIEFEVLTEDVDPDLVSKGLMMDADYRQKTMNLAEERKKIEAKQADLDKAISQAADFLLVEAKELESEEMKELRQYDPEKYYAKRIAIEEKVEKLKKLQEQRQSEIDAKQAELIKAEKEKYTQLIPDWLDDQKRTEDQRRMVKSLRDIGFSDEDIGGLYDSRLMALVRKAALYDEISSKSLESKRVKDDVISMKPNSTSKVEKETLNSAKDRLKHTGHIKDAQAAIMAMMTS